MNFRCPIYLTSLSCHFELTFDHHVGLCFTVWYAQVSPADVFEKQEQWWGWGMKWQGWGRMYYVHVYLPIEMWFLLFGVPFKKEQRILDLLLGKTSGQTVQLNDYRHLVSSKHKGKRSWYVLHILSQFHKPRESLQILADLHHWHSSP